MKLLRSWPRWWHQSLPSTPSDCSSGWTVSSFFTSRPKSCLLHFPEVPRDGRTAVLWCGVCTGFMIFWGRWSRGALSDRVRICDVIQIKTKIRFCLSPRFQASTVGALRSATNLVGQGQQHADPSHGPVRLRLVGGHLEEHQKVD